VAPNRSSAGAIRTLAFVALVSWATLQGALLLWDFRHDAARRDFGHLVESARSWRATGVLYEDEPRANLNPPHASVVLFTPLTWISFDAAVRFWVVAQVITMIASLFLIAGELRLTPARLEWIVPTVVASAMTTHNWIEGQVGGVLLVAGAVAWRAARRNQQNLASLAVAGLLSLKPQLGLLLFATNVKVALRVVLIGAAGLAAGVLLMGLPVWMSWLNIMQAKGLQLPPWNVSIPSMLYRSGVKALLPAYIVLALSIFAITWRATLKDADLDRSWLLWGLASLLLVPIAWVYYAGAFLGPLIAWGERHRWPPAAIAAVLLWLIPLQAHVVLGSPYTWGALLLWFSVLTTKLQPAL
jgi:hypothetical protein